MQIKNSIINLLENKKIQFLTICIIFLPFVIVCMYCNPAADDFIYAYRSNQSSLFDFLIQDYLNWNGRYIANILVYLNPIRYGNFNLYKLIRIKKGGFLIFRTF